MKTAKGIENEWMAATRDIKDIEKRMQAKSFGKLNLHSKELIRKEYSELVEKQMNILMELVDLSIDPNQKEAIVKRATKLT